MAFFTNTNLLSSADCDSDPESWRRTRTPSPEHIYCYQGSARTLPPRDLLLPQAPQVPQQSPQLQPAVGCMQMVAVQVVMMPVPPPPAPFTSPQFQESRGGSPVSSHSRMPSGGSEVSTMVSQDSDAASSCSTLEVSAGTRGHPFHCGDACKFAGKPRGCKDGANCTHCHLCKWSKSTAKKQAKLRQQQQPSAPVNLSACFSGAR